MSVHDEGYGDSARPTLEFESDFANRFGGVGAEGDRPWGAAAHPAHRSEDSLMTSGPSRPGQPTSAQRSIFGTGRGPVFAQMPSYTPVTRGADQPAMPEPRAPGPQKTDFGAYARQDADPQAPQKPSGSGYAANQNGAPPSYQPSGGQSGGFANPDFPNPFPPQTYQPQPQPQSYQPQQPSYQPQPQPQSYQPQPHQQSYQPQQPSYQPQPHQPAPAFSGRYASQPSPQPPRPAPSQPSPYQREPGPSHAFQETGFPDRIFPAEATQPASFNHGQSADYAEQDFTDGHYAEGAGSGADASFPDASFPDASFPDASFPGEKAEGDYAAPGHHDGFGDRDALNLDHGATPYGTEEGAEGFADPATQDYQPEQDYQAEEDYQPEQGYQAEQGYQSDQNYQAAPPLPSGAPRPLPSHHSLQAFDAGYDQPPQIALGRTHYPNQAPPHNAPQDFYESDQGDADFLDESQFMSPGDAEMKPARKFGLRSRSIYMVGSALLGAIALGGALAFAYKQSGGAMSGDQPPVVQADSRPVKEAPQEAGGKDFPHKNKLIYERLQNGDQPEAERIVPRQEDLAMPAMPGGAVPAPAGMAPMQPPAVATVDDPNAADGGPRRVKTMVVRPDGTMAEAPAAEASPQQAAAPAAPAAPQQVAFAQPQMPAPPMPEAAPAPPPPPQAEAAPAADPQPVAAIPAPRAEPAPAPAKPSQYVVQVGSKQNQTDALATFADMQQKYPTLLASYRPMVQKADLGSKGVWYRLRIGPIADKSAATKLCGQLKSQGHPDCLVMASQ
jgi:hypothetical protein